MTVRQPDPHMRRKPSCRACRAATTRKPLIVKLTPNVTDVTEIARAAVAGGADAVSLINTLLGMAIDARTRRPKLARVVGGLSGPAVKPVALRMVWETHKAVDVPHSGHGRHNECRRMPSSSCWPGPRRWPSAPRTS